MVGGVAIVCVKCIIISYMLFDASMLKQAVSMFVLQLKRSTDWAVTRRKVTKDAMLLL